MKYYGVIGESTQVINERKKPVCPAGYIQMRHEKPTPQHIAVKHAGKRLGDWVLPPEQVTEDEKDNAE